MQQIDKTHNMVILWSTLFPKCSPFRISKHDEGVSLHDCTVTVIVIPADISSSLPLTSPLLPQRGSLTDSGTENCWFSSCHPYIMCVPSFCSFRMGIMYFPSQQREGRQTWCREGWTNRVFYCASVCTRKMRNYELQNKIRVNSLSVNVSSRLEMLFATHFSSVIFDSIKIWRI